MIIFNWIDEYNNSNVISYILNIHCIYYYFNK